VKYGFDLDGTLDHPPILAEANAAFDAGHEVHIITGYLPGTSYDRPMKVAKLQALGARYTALHMACGPTLEHIGMEKARLVRELGLAQMIDDSPIFVEAMRRWTSARIVELRHSVAVR